MLRALIANRPHGIDSVGNQDDVRSYPAPCGNDAVWAVDGPREVEYLAKAQRERLVFILVVRRAAGRSLVVFLGIVCFAIGRTRALHLFDACLRHTAVYATGRHRAPPYVDISIAGDLAGGFPWSLWGLALAREVACPAKIRVSDVRHRSTGCRFSG